MRKTIIKINGMSCGMCEAHVNDVIRRTFSVKSVKSSYKKGQTEVLSDEPLPADQLNEVIAATGYQVLKVTDEEYVKKSFWKK